MQPEKAIYLAIHCQLLIHLSKIVFGQLLDNKGNVIDKRLMQQIFLLLDKVNNLVTRALLKTMFFCFLHLIATLQTIVLQKNDKSEKPIE